MGADFVTRAHQVVNPDEGAGSTSTSRRPSVEVRRTIDRHFRGSELTCTFLSLQTPRTDRCSYYSCSSELAILSADFAV